MARKYQGTLWAVEAGSQAECQCHMSIVLGTGTTHKVFQCEAPVVSAIQYVKQMLILKAGSVENSHSP